MNVYAYAKDTNYWVDIFGLTPWKDLGIGFEEWWDTKATIDSISKNKSSVERALRAMNGGNNHEMFPVSLAEKTKELEFKYSELEKMTIKTSKIEFNIDGLKGAHPSSGIFNNSASALFHKKLISELKETETKTSAKNIIKRLHNKHMTIKNICN